MGQRSEGNKDSVKWKGLFSFRKPFFREITSNHLLTCVPLFYDFLNRYQGAQVLNLVTVKILCTFFCCPKVRKNSAAARKIGTYLLWKIELMHFVNLLFAIMNVLDTWSWRYYSLRSSWLVNNSMERRTNGYLQKALFWRTSILLECL